MAVLGESWVGRAHRCRFPGACGQSQGCVLPLAPLVPRVPRDSPSRTLSAAERGGGLWREAPSLSRDALVSALSLAAL